MNLLQPLTILAIAAFTAALWFCGYFLFRVATGFAFPLWMLVVFLTAVFVWTAGIMALITGGGRA